MIIGGNDGDAEKGNKPGGSEQLKLKYIFSCESIYGIVYNPLAGYGRNQAIKQSSGKFLCFMDAVSYISLM